ncbi:MAG: tetratricopeptide repeat protein, partial [Eubacteriales bacterium]
MRRKEVYFAFLMFAVIIVVSIWRAEQAARLAVAAVLFAALYLLFYSSEIAATYYLYLADRSLKACDTKRALDYYRKIYQVAPTRISGKAALAVIKTVEGMWDEAEKLYREVLRLRPNDVNLQYNLAVTLIKKGCYEEGITNLLMIIHFYPQLYYPHAALGEVYLHLGRYEEAYHHLSIALHLNAGDPVTRDNLEAVI